MFENKLQEYKALPPIGEWVEFKLIDLFTLERGKGPNATVVKKELGNTPYVAASMFNNGVTVRTKIKPTYKGNKITIANNGAVGATFYQTESFLASTDVTVLTPKFELNQHIAAFLKTIIELEKPKYSYGRKWGLSRMNSSIIKLPVGKNKQPDWQAIEDYMKGLHYSEAVNKLEKGESLLAFDETAGEKVELQEVDKWGEFKLTDLFTLETGRGATATYVKDNPGETAYVTAIKHSNGISARGEVDPTHQAGTITIPDKGAGTGMAFFHEEPINASANVKVLSPKFKINRLLASFILPILRLEGKKYSYGRTWSIARMNETKIKLPATPEGKPDWEHMENYIKGLKGSTYL